MPGVGGIRIPSGGGGGGGAFPPAAPTVTAPATGALVYVGQSVTLTATSTDSNLGSISWVATPQGGGSETVLETDASSPYSAAHTVALATGVWTIVARATRWGLTTDSAAVTVTVIPSIVAWYDPAAAYITKDGSNVVSAWASRAGTGGTAWDLPTAGGVGNLVWSATSGRNGGPGVTFNGLAGGYIKSGAAAISQPYTIVHCLKCTNVAAGPYASDGGVVNDSRVMYIQPADGKLQVYAGAGVISPTAIANNVWSTIVGVFNGASSISRVDGSASAAGNCGATNSSGMCLGAQAGGAAGLFPGTMSHTFVFGSAVAAADLAILETWLAAA